MDQWTKAKIACVALEGMTKLGMPIPVHIKSGSKPTVRRNPKRIQAPTSMHTSRIGIAMVRRSREIAGGRCDIDVFQSC
jgi:hypothetical protein